MEAKYELLSFARTINDFNPSLPKGRSDCFDVGIWGGCGIECPVFVRGDCDVESPEDFVNEMENKLSLEDIELIKEMYPSIKKEMENKIEL